MTKPTHLIVAGLAERFRRTKGKDISRNDAALARLLEAVERGVRELQTQDATEFHVPSIASDSMGALHLRIRMTREEALAMGQVRDAEQLLD